jgi:hypothetical protein
MPPNGIDEPIKNLDEAVRELYAEVEDAPELEGSEEERLQMAMDRLSKMTSTLSNVMKKLAETQTAITQKLK